MTASSFKSRLVTPRRVRAAVALFILAVYLIGGVLHGLYDLDVARPQAQASVSLADNGIDPSQQGAVVEHHCHGCFAASVPALSATTIEVVSNGKIVAIPMRESRVAPPDIDPPPPKSLT